MGIFDKAENKAQDLAGQAKEKIGEATDNKDLQAEGVADQGEAGLKDVGEKIKDVASDVGDKIKDVFKKD
ncbi:CsbD family protein [Arthrobacter russicus]|jgi:uncharacterized protein YjbJ (UPF0337 family)|uniref:Uncharacterized protein YjbJ (UPF0337 family) n=1 Tax=Arthrobacter russicus TaxID=172040 RepID=A0ABU1JBS3_9MICC|nr:CsbD family protein [Arthrobacter russicus]MDN5666958.1 CsbD family protein [Renibacterium salmoninarum]MDR6269877.1 uncharacterized protein YjbJ (UPF0337 family) [Arthrobacter russicus]